MTNDSDTDRMIKKRNHSQSMNLLTIISIFTKSISIKD